MGGKRVEGFLPDEVVTDDNELSVCYIYKQKSTPAGDTIPQRIVCACTCPKPKENYPFHDDVFAYIHSIAPKILKFSLKYDVPPIAVAGSIADEYNTRFLSVAVSNAKGVVDKGLAVGKGVLKSAFDFAQDKIFPNMALPYIRENAIPVCFYPPDYMYGFQWSYCEYLPWVDAGIDKNMLEQWIQKQYEEIVKKDPENIKERERFKYWLSGGDYGKGNISIRTAIDLYEESKADNRDELPYMTRVQLLEYLLTDDGTAEFAALAIRAAKRQMKKHLDVLPQRKQEAVLVTYYKQGLRYYKKFLDKQKGKETPDKIQSGEGCRTCYQRDRFAKELGIEVPPWP